MLFNKRHQLKTSGNLKLLVLTHFPLKYSFTQHIFNIKLNSPFPGITN